MSRLAAFARRFLSLFQKRRHEAAMKAEFQAHLDVLIERNLAAGLSPEEARYAALRAFGGVEQIKEECRDQFVTTWINALWRDLRFSLRSLRRSPAFSMAVVATLALCIGANTAVFSALYGLILKPLPFSDPGQVVEVYNMRLKSGQPKLRVSIPQYLDFKAHADLFAKIALWDGWMFNIGDDGATDRLIGMQVTADYFGVMGVTPLIGRFFTEDECVPGRDGVVVLTQTYWENQFQADPAVLGKVVTLSRRKYTIIGVAPRSLEAVSTAPVLIVPLSWTATYTMPQYRLATMFSMCARIKPSVAHGTALAQLQTLEDRFIDSSAAGGGFRDFVQNVGQRIGLGQLRAEQTKSVKSGLVLLQGCALLVLLLGCVNVASLMLARTNSRRTELAVRQALGAGRGALARQLLTEAVGLAVGGGVAGLVLAWAGLRVINTYTAKIIFGSPPVALDGRVLGFALVSSLLVALLIGLLPVWRIGRISCWQGTFQSGSRGASRSGGVRAVSGGLVIAQVALALVLLVGAGLLTHSFVKVMAIKPGFDAGKIIHARVAVDSSYTNLADVQAMQAHIIEKLREIPGVESVAYAAAMPGREGLSPTTLPLFGMPAGKEGTYPTAFLLAVSPDFLPTMGIHLLAGRNFTAADLLPTARPVFIVDRKFAERYFPDRSAVGQLFAMRGIKDQNPQDAAEIVGVAETAKYGALDDPDAEPNVYRAMPLGAGGVSILLRTTRTLEDILPVIRARVREVDSGLPVYEAQTMQAHLEETGANRRGILWLLGTFAAIALILSAVGIYGMLAYDVTQRTKEIGIRGALGATRGQIVALILQQGLWKTGIGVAIGLGGAVYLSRFIRTLLYDVAPTDPLIFAAIAILLLLVALVASWLPARRAAKVDPMVALRCE